MNPKEDSSGCETLKAIPPLSQSSGLSLLLQAKADSCRESYAHIVSRPGIQAAFFWTRDWGSRSPSRGSRSSDHDRGCDRRDAWVGTEFLPWKTITNEPTVGKATSSRSAKWRSALSACSSALEKCSTRADIVRAAIFANNPYGSSQTPPNSTAFIDVPVSQR
jgi:hypothetical protein